MRCVLALHKTLSATSPTSFEVLLPSLSLQFTVERPHNQRFTLIFAKFVKTPFNTKLLKFII